MESKFTLSDWLEMHEIILNLRKETCPVNEHVDPLSVDCVWHRLDSLLIRMGNAFKEQLIDKESIEKIFGKKINSFELAYDDQGMLKGINIVPVQSVEFLNVNFAILPPPPNLLEND